LFNDPIHGCIEVHKPALLIVNSPQFQRLRNIKQVGCTCNCYAEYKMKTLLSWHLANIGLYNVAFSNKWIY